MDIDLINMTNPAYNSFNESLKFEVYYSYFLDEMRNHFKGWNLKTRIDLYEDLSVMLPHFKFFSDIADLSSVDLIQGHFFQSLAQYEKEEQILCSLEGNLTVRLGSPIYRQEVYAGDDMYVSYTKHGGNKTTEEMWKREQNESPVNFFSPDLENYPNFEYFSNGYEIDLRAGECVYIPAFYFYQVMGIGLPEVAAKKGIPTAIALQFKYKPNSSLLSAFFNAIEAKVLF